MKRLPLALIVLSLALALCAGSLLWYLSDRMAAGGSETTSTGSIGGPFTLTDQNGHVRSDGDFRGKYMLLYFGYSFCPDVCPTTLGVMADAYSRLGSRAKKIVPVFVTIDPERDTPAALKKYLAAFGPEFVGLTGTLPQIKSVAHEYGVYFAKHPLPGGNYSMDHTSIIYLMGPDGKLVTYYNEQMTPDALAKDLASRI